MSATTVANWAMSDKTLLQTSGDLLLLRDEDWAGHVSPQITEPSTVPGASLWSTGRKWVQWEMANKVKHKSITDEEGRCLRTELRATRGVTFRWQNDGLHVTCSESMKGKMREITNRRRAGLGEFIHTGLEGIELRSLKLWDLQGRTLQLKCLEQLVRRPARSKVGDLLEVHWLGVDHVLFRPVQQQLPMDINLADLFKELCCNLLVNYPEIVYRGRRMEELMVHHHMDDPHHIFHLTLGETPELQHTWGFSTKRVLWATGKEDVSQAVKRWIGAQELGLWVIPHPWLTRMRPLWAGKRRWSMTRKQLKKQLARSRSQKAQTALEKIEEKWQKQHRQISAALSALQWGRLHKLEEVPAYQVQNVTKHKWGRLRLWVNKETRFNCKAGQCAGLMNQGAEHLIWACPEAEVIWDVLLQLWNNGDDDGRTNHQRRSGMLQEFFEFRLNSLPHWIIQWGRQQTDAEWNGMNDIVQDLWASGCALTVTVIWRWNVNRVHSIDTQQSTLEEAAAGLRSGLMEAGKRYTMSMYPLNAESGPKLEAANFLLKSWRGEQVRRVLTTVQGPMRIGFFYGGSRGNPGPGGSGSAMLELVVDEVVAGQVESELSWAAATALGGRTMINNVAEYVGLQRLLAKAVEMKWNNIHVVGDSALIIGWMRSKHKPKSSKMRHWFRITQRLADICGVASWSHHYRQHDKTADWIANYAMDNKQSVTVTASTMSTTHALYSGADSRHRSDIAWWWETTGRKWCEESRTRSSGMYLQDSRSSRM